MKLRLKQKIIMLTMKQLRKLRLKQKKKNAAANKKSVAVAAKLRFVAVVAASAPKHHKKLLLIVGTAIIMKGFMIREINNTKQQSDLKKCLEIKL